MLASLGYSLNAVMPVFLLIILGGILKKKGLMSEDFIRDANRICFNIAFPAMLFHDMYFRELSDFFDGGFVLFLLLALFGMAILSVLLVLLLVKDKSKRGAIVQCTFRGTTSLLGFPILTNMFGDAGLGPFVLMLAISVPVHNSLSVVLLSLLSNDNHSLHIGTVVKRIFTSPFILSSVLALIFAAFRIPLPTVLDHSIASLGALATPVALLALGGMFDLQRMKNNRRYVTLATLYKLVLVPALVVTAAVLLGFRSYELGAFFILGAAPSVITSSMLAYNTGNDHELAGQIAISTTLFAAFSMTAIVFALKYFAFI